MQLLAWTLDKYAGSGVTCNLDTHSFGSGESNLVRYFQSVAVLSITSHVLLPVPMETKQDQNKGVQDPNKGAYASMTSRVNYSFALKFRQRHLYLLYLLCFLFWSTRCFAGLGIEVNMWCSFGYWPKCKCKCSHLISHCNIKGLWSELVCLIWVIMDSMVTMGGDLQPGRLFGWSAADWSRPATNKLRKKDKKV